MQTDIYHTFPVLASISFSAKPETSDQAATGGAIVPVANLVAGSWPLKTNRLTPPGARR